MNMSSYANSREDSARQNKKILIAIPNDMITKMEEIAHAEHRNRSDLVREALRRYMQNYEKQKQVPYVQPQPAPYPA